MCTQSCNSTAYVIELQIAMNEILLVHVLNRQRNTMKQDSSLLQLRLVFGLYGYLSQAYQRFVKKAGTPPPRIMTALMTEDDGIEVCWGHRCVAQPTSKRSFL
eukprot:TRINITY_DN10704_c0_g1_i3.p3 TRINITY_DN10704_c0_g1~~TRINITY_DN10704_c0_g1_i3.p3  ORF type:complete len:103 (+),score=4.70 TRINITY_DN10704_c0_g1_i3:1035-1343(+)